MTAEYILSIVRSYMLNASGFSQSRLIRFHEFGHDDGCNGSTRKYCRSTDDVLATDLLAEMMKSVAQFHANRTQVRAQIGVLFIVNRTR